MVDSRNDNYALLTGTGNPWRRAGAVTLVFAALGLPVNGIWAYALLVAAAVIIFCGRITERARAWALALGAVAVAAVVATLIVPAPIAEGENVFLPGHSDGVLARELPPDVYK